MKKNTQAKTIHQKPRLLPPKRESGAAAVREMESEIHTALRGVVAADC